MPLNYFLVKNELSDKPGSHRAITRSAGTIDQSRLIDLIMEHNSSITRGDITSLFTIMNEIVARELLNGYSLNLPLVNTSFSIKGQFFGSLATYEKGKQKAKIKITKGVLLRKIEENLKPEITDLERSKKIKEVKDSFSDTIDSILTVGDDVEIKGLQLKLAGDDPACGVWFIGANGIETPAARIIDNKPSRILARIPSLTPGKYRVKVVTQFSGGGEFLKTPRVFLYEKQLTV
ncbi:MAG: DUF4469 domain-containing protein [Oscillospiraceae bacterium]|nr:DUF4469 domain-containing protein [Oscillospiraceae bacterium]